MPTIKRTVRAGGSFPVLISTIAAVLTTIFFGVMGVVCVLGIFTWPLFYLVATLTMKDDFGAVMPKKDFDRIAKNNFEAGKNKCTIIIEEPTHAVLPSTAKFFITYKKED